VQRQLHLLIHSETSTMEREKSDIFDRVTNLIVEAIEAGVNTRRLPWHATTADRFTPLNAVSHKPYRGVNLLALWVMAEVRGYPSGFWATYPQWQQLGAQVRKGEKSAPVVFWKFPDRSDHEEEPEESASSRGVLARGYAVFNAAQVEGFNPPTRPVLSESQRVARAEAFFAGVGADVRTGGEVACYDPCEDASTLPPFSAFRDPVGYYAILGHEMTHWSGAEQRLNRELSTRFDSEAYAMEELVAELGAAFLCALLGLSNAPRPDHAAYLASWLTVLKRDKRAVFTAASHALRAVDWLTAATSAEQPLAA
jgi:antirestriction protein ArdC